MRTLTSSVALLALLLLLILFAACTPTPAVPPAAPTPTPTAVVTTSAPVQGQPLSQAWRAILPNGACPAGFPIKGNVDSHIFHAPGGRFYATTRNDRVQCYATAGDAIAGGFRRSAE